MFNLADYTKAITEAERKATKYGVAYVVVHYKLINECQEIQLIGYVEIAGNFDTNTLIVASVDHHGIVTESKWVKEQIEKLGEVAA